MTYSPYIRSFKLTTAQTPSHQPHLLGYSCCGGLTRPHWTGLFKKCADKLQPTHGAVVEGHLSKLEAVGNLALLIGTGAVSHRGQSKTWTHTHLLPEWDSPEVWPGRSASVRRPSEVSSQVRNSGVQFNWGRLQNIKVWFQRFTVQIVNSSL